MAARARERSPRTRPAAAAPLPPAARALWIALAATLALRALAVALPGRWLWGADLGRDLPPLAFWLPWLAAAFALHPALARPLACRLPRGDAGVTSLGVVLALAAGALALAFPDRILFTGDTALRHGAFAANDHPLQLAPQALPGDLWLHWALPRWLLAHAGVPAETTYRALGALVAVANGLAALALARVAGLRGAAAAAVMAVAGWTAALALFDGYAKSFVELAALTLVVAAALVAIARTGRGVLALGLATAAALALHRAALVFVPAWAAGLALAARAGAWRRPAFALAVAAPLGVLASLAPRIAHTLGSFDAANHVALPGTTPGAFAAQVLSAGHLADVANLLLLLVPALPLALALGARADGRAPWPERVAWAALLVPVLLVALLTHPQQGLFRDWDVFVTTGVALAAWIAVRTGERIARSEAAWLAVPLALVAIAPGVQWLAHQSDVPRGIARVHAILAGPPGRTQAERAAGFDRIGLLAFSRGEASEAARACSLSVLAVPSARVIGELGMAQTQAGRYADAKASYLRAVSLNPDFTLAWRGVAATSSALGDREHMRLAVDALVRLDPQGETTRDAAAWLRANPPTAK